jgi:hypothetical protein
MTGNRRMNPFAFLLLGFWSLWGFGFQSLGTRLTAEVEGVVIASRDVPSTGAPRYGTEYTIRGPNGRDRSYSAGPTYGFLPRSMPVGTQIRKQRWHLDYERDGRTVNDFPIGFTSIVLGIALACVVWGIVLWRERATGAA